MPCLINGIAVLIFSLLGRVIAQAQVNVQDVDNAEQFALLCRIYNVAKNPPIDHVDLQDPYKIVEEINTMNTSLADEKQLNETKQVGNSWVSQLKPTTTRETTVTQAILKRITQKAHTILEEIEIINVTEEIEKAKGEFNKVIFGDGGNESHLFEDTLKGVGDRGTACGKPGKGNKGSHAGKNLIVDFFCLCAMTTNDSGISNVCGVYVGGNSGKKNPDKHGWGASAPSGSSSVWASIKKGCGRLMHKDPKSTTEGCGVLEDFMRHLETGGVYRWGSTSKIDGSKRKSGMVGTGVGTQDGHHVEGFVCDGSRGNKGTLARSRGATTVNPAGICVYYGPNEWEDNIVRLKKLKTALNTVDALNKQTATIQRNIQKLQMLLHRAEKIYETAKVITEVHNPLYPPISKRPPKDSQSTVQLGDATHIPTLSYSVFYFFNSKHHKVTTPNTITLHKPLINMLFCLILLFSPIFSFRKECK